MLPRRSSSPTRRSRPSSCSAAKRRPGAKKHCTPNEIPTLAEATRWVAEIGGYTKSRNSAPPGSVTIMRGLEYLETLVQGRLLQIQLSRDKLD